MSKRVRITLSDEWFRWADDEATHRDQSLSQLVEDALTAFEREVVSGFEDSLAMAYRGRARRSKLIKRIKSKLTPAELEIVHMRPLK